MVTLMAPLELFRMKMKTKEFGTLRLGLELCLLLNMSFVSILWESAIFSVLLSGK